MFETLVSRKVNGKTVEQRPGYVLTIFFFFFSIQVLLFFQGIA